MNLLSDDKFIPSEITELLLQKLLATAPQLIGTIVPDVFIKSPFFYYYHQTITEEYRKYRFIRAIQFKEDKREKKATVRNPALLTLEEFAKKEYQPMPHHFPDEIVAMLCDVFYQIAGGSCKIYDVDNYFYDFEDSERYGQIIDKLVYQLGLTSAERFSYRSYLQHPYRKVNRVDLRHVYEHIFKFLKSEDLKWHFKEVYFDFLLRLEREIEAKNEVIKNGGDPSSFGNLEAIASYLELGERDPKNGKVVFPDFGTEFINYDKDPDPIIKTYIDVYGVNPAGYPPRMTDYI